MVSKREQSYSVPFYSVGLNSLEMSGGNFHGYDMVMSDCEPGPARLGVDFCHVIFVTCRVSGGRPEMASKNFLYMILGENLQNDITARL